MSSAPYPRAWKAKYQKFVDPNYAHVSQVNGQNIAAYFEACLNDLLDFLPDAPVSAANGGDPYMFESHMGAFVRTLDEAKDHFVKASLAYYAKRGSGESVAQDAKPADDVGK
jgi:hypothetical protein